MNKRSVNFFKRKKTRKNIYHTPTFTQQEYEKILYINFIKFLTT